MRHVFIQLADFALGLTQVACLYKEVLVIFFFSFFDHKNNRCDALWSA